MTENEIGYKIRGACFTVYNELGPGLLESAYELALMIELRGMGLRVENQVVFDVCYKGSSLGTGYRLDLLVEGLVLIELKSVDNLCAVHHKQLLTYLRLSGLKLGYLINFNTDKLTENIIRYANKL